MHIREATDRDAPAITEIYNQIIRSSPAVWTEQTVDAVDRQDWIRARHLRGFPVLVVEDSRRGVVAFGSFGDFRPLPGYRTTVEHSLHVHAEHRRRGLGRRLLGALIDRAALLDVHVMVAGIDGDNEASLRLHRELGFREVGRLPEVGRKFGRWLDLVLLQREIGPGDALRDVPVAPEPASR